MIFLSLFKFAWRSFLQQIKYNLINVSGLALAITSITLILLWAFYELSYDKHFPKSSKIYRPTIEVKEANGYASHFARIYGNLPIEEYIPEIKQKIRLAPKRNTSVRIGENKFYTQKIYSVDTGVFEVFDLKLIQGDPQTALKHPKSVIVSESLAKKYLANTEALGMEISLLGENEEQAKHYIIKGVFKDIPANSHLHFDMLLSFDNPEKISGWAYNYLLLHENAEIEEMKTKLPEFEKVFFKNTGKATYKLHMQSIEDIHLFSDKDREIEKNGSYQSVILSISSAFAILILALVNFINLNIALLLREIKFLANNKIFGASKQNMLTFQIFKVLIVGMFSVLLSVFFIELLIYFLQQASWINSVFLIDQWGRSIQIMMILLILIAFVGSYPVFLFVSKRLSGSKIFTQNSSLVQLFSPNKKFLFRKILLVFQFAVTVLLLIATILVHNQMELLTNKQLLGEKDEIIVLKKLAVPVRKDYTIFKQELLKNPLIKDVSASMEAPPDQVLDATFFEMDNLPEAKENSNIYINPVSDNYFQFYGQTIISGEDFPKYRKDQNYENYIINESALKMLGYTNAWEVVGKSFKLKHPYIDFKGGQIVGVVKDFHYSTLHHKINPMVYFQNPMFYISFFIKIESKNTKNALAYIQKCWEDIYPDYAFDYSMADDLYALAYKNEIGQSKLATLFTFLAIIISVIGIFGLTSIFSEQRTKEIGIRKILGASSLNIIYKLSLEFLILILIAGGISICITWYLMDKWLQNFAYSINLQDNWWVFASCFLSSLVLVLGIVGLKSFKVSQSNPVLALKYS